MKKIIAALLAVLCVLAAVACGGTKEGDGKDPKSEGVMTYAEYEKAETDTKVVIETFVQAKQGWWEKDGVGVGTFYTQDADGAYFLYDMPCSKEDYDKLVPGTKIKVEGFKSVWSGEVEVMDAKFTIIEGSTYVAKAFDVTSLLGKEDLIKHQNKFVSFKGMTVEKANDDGAAYIYNYDGSGKDGDDLYFNVSINGETYSFTVESYLCGKDSDVYKAVKELKVGDKIDLEGFLYWYNGANPHITSVKKA